MMVEGRNHKKEKEKENRNNKLLFSLTGFSIISFCTFARLILVIIISDSVFTNTHTTGWLCMMAERGRDKTALWL